MGLGHSTVASQWISRNNRRLGRAGKVGRDNAGQAGDDVDGVGPNKGRGDAVKLNHGVNGAKGFLTTTLATAPPHRRFCRKMLTTLDNCEKLYFGVATAQPNARISKQRDLVLLIIAVLNLKSDFRRIHLRGHSIEIMFFDISVRLLTFSQKPTMGGSRR